MEPKQQAPTPAPTMTTPEPPAGMPQSPAPEPAHEPAFVGPLIGVLIIILVLLLGGLYLWGSARMEETERATQDTVMEETSLADTDASQTNEFSQMEAELDASLAGIDTNFSDIDAALDAESNTTAE